MLIAWQIETAQNGPNCVTKTGKDSTDESRTEEDPAFFAQLIWPLPLVGLSDQLSTWIFVSNFCWLYLFINLLKFISLPPFIFRLSAHPLTIVKNNLARSSLPGFALCGPFSRDWYLLLQNLWLSIFSQQFRSILYEFAMHNRVQELCVGSWPKS